MKYIQMLRDFVSKLVAKFKQFAFKPAPSVPTIDVQPAGPEPKPPVEVVPMPAPTPPADKPNVIDLLLGGTPHPIVPQDTGAPQKPEYHEGFDLVGSGHPLRNTVPGGVQTFTFTLPTKGTYQVDTMEVPGSEDGVKFNIQVLDATTGVVETSGGPFNSHFGQVFGQGEAGTKQVKVENSGDTSFGVVVYF